MWCSFLYWVEFSDDCSEVEEEEDEGEMMVVTTSSITLVPHASQYWYVTLPASLTVSKLYTFGL